MTDTIPKEPSLLDLCFEKIGGFDSLPFAFAISLTLLVIVSLLKYWILNESKAKEWMFFFLEIPIDVCVILTTIIITGFMRGTGGAIDEKRAATGVVLVFCSLIISMICCFIRRAAMKLSYAEKAKHYFLSAVCSILNFIVAGLWVYVILDYICTHG